MEGTPHHTIDLRSDTVTYPSIKMKEAMFRAPMGDDVFGDDPTVKGKELDVHVVMHRLLLTDYARAVSLQMWTLQRTPNTVQNEIKLIVQFKQF